MTPFGIAALVVFLALSQDVEARLTVDAVVVAIMVLNLIVMLVTRKLLPVLALVLPILGAVRGVVQVALGLAELIARACRVSVDVAKRDHDATPHDLGSAYRSMP